ncbi:MAG: two component transcriptional regulator [Chloroflexi bacterium OLB14]|nr:MAG: two component transcriptional regulator [Chloroflexi bacterium OLB14]
MNLTNSNSPRVLIICDQDATAPIWGYIIREKGLIAIVETSIERAMQRPSEETPDLIVVDLNAIHAQRIELCKKIRSMSASPILLFLPYNNEQEILEAYQNGVDECVVKPISPAIFLAKILAWSKRSWSEPMKPRHTGRLRLDPSHRSALTKNKKEIKLTNLEFRLLHLLMSRPGFVFPAEEIIETIWGAQGDVILLKNVVYRLRKKIEEETNLKELIKTWPGGYSFIDD